MKKGEHKGRRDGPRGLYAYGQIIDSDGNKIRVQQSSAVGDSYCWIMVEDRQGRDAYMHLGQMTAPSPHLNVRDAKMLRDALDRFIKEARNG